MSFRDPCHCNNTVLMLSSWYTTKQVLVNKNKLILMCDALAATMSMLHHVLCTRALSRSCGTAG